VTPNWDELDTAVTAADEKREGKFFKKRDRPFFAAAEARGDARDEAGKKFIMALAAGELRPMIQKYESNEELSPSIWDNKAHGFYRMGRRGKRDPRSGWQHLSLCGFDAIVDGHGRARPIFFETSHFQDWLAKQGMAAAIAPLKVGPDGGRPSPMHVIEAELGQWIEGGLIRAQIQRWTPKGETVGFGKAGLSRALAGWAAKAKDIDIKAGSIETATYGRKKNKSLSEKFATALRLIKK
jgi:hypothetical protein